MELKRRVARALSVFAVAIAMGHVVQILAERNKLDARMVPQVAEPKAIKPVAAGPQTSILPTVSVAESAPDAQQDARILASSEPVVTASGLDKTVPAPVLATALPGLNPTVPEPSAAQAALNVAPGPDEEQTAPTVLAQIALSPATEAPVAPVLQVVSASDAESSIVPKAMERAMFPQETCIEEMDLAILSDAIIEVTLRAACHPDQRVVLRHSDLAITARTSAEGKLFVQLPALASAGDVSLRFADGTTINGAIPVADLATLRRFAVQWMQDDSFGIHAFENGADYDGAGHLSAANPGKLPFSGDVVGGYLMILGDASTLSPMLAEVYTYPRDAMAPVEVSVDAEVTAATCGRELLGEVIASRGGKATATDLALAMPDCTAIGDILVLQNLGSEMALAGLN